MPPVTETALWIFAVPVITLTVLVAVATLIALLAARERANRAHRVLCTLLGSLQNLLRRNSNRDDR